MTVQPLVLPQTPQQAVKMLISHGVDKQLAKDLQARVTQGSSPSDPHAQAASLAFLGTVTTLLARGGGHLTTVH